MAPDVSIGIPTYNRPEMTARAVASVYAQDYIGLIEAVVYDDGSAVPYASALAPPPRAAAGPRRLVIGRGATNRGIAYAKNRALELGTGDLRGILDSDDYYEPAFVSRCVAELQADPALVAVYTDNWTEVDGRRQLAEAGDWSIETLLRCRLRGDCYLARWSALARVGLHDERFVLEVDYDLFYGLAELGPLKRIALPLQVVTEHAGRTTADRTRAAYWHAAGLGKWGYPITWAEQRAARYPEWDEAIRDGYAQGRRWRDEAERAAG